MIRTPGFGHQVFFRTIQIFFVYYISDENSLNMY